VVGLLQVETTQQRGWPSSYGNNSATYWPASRGNNLATWLAFFSRKQLSNIVGLLHVETTQQRG